MMPLTTITINDYNKAKKQHFGFRMVHTHFRTVQTFFFRTVMKKVNLGPWIYIIKASNEGFCLFLKLELGNALTLYRVMMRDSISWQNLDIVISWYGVSVVFSWFKRLHYTEVMWFSEPIRLFSLLFYLPLPTFPHYWWLFIKKCHRVSVLWHHQ